MQSKDGDELIERLLYKAMHNIPICREELVQLTLCPLMSGKKTQKERIKAAYVITMNATEIDPQEVRKIEAVIYAMADKILESMELEEIMGEMSMTRLGQMLVNEGLEKAKLENARNLIDVLDEHMIAERIGIPLETVKKLKAEYLKSQNTAP